MTTPAGLDPALFATMTPEEQEAFTDTTPEDIASLAATGAEKDPVHRQAEAADTGKDDEDDDSVDDDAPPVEGAAAAPQSDPPPPAAVVEKPPAEQPAAAAPPSGFYRFELPADYEERTNAAKTAEKEIYDKLKAGELAVDDLPEQLAIVREEQRQLDAIRTKHEIATQSQEQSMEATRQVAIQRLFDQAKATDNVDYQADKGKLRDLDVFIRALAGDEANEDKPLAWFLDEAHKRVKTLHGVVTPAPKDDPAPATKTPAQIKADAAAARKPDLSGVPKDLSQIPGGDGPGDVGGEFEDIMSLEGEAYEQAIARLAKSSPDRFARFVSGTH